MIDERAGMGAIGDMQRYMAFKAARGIEAAASNPGAAPAMRAGLGLGAGFGMMMPGMIAGAMGAGPARRRARRPAAVAGARPAARRRRRARSARRSVPRARSSAAAAALRPAAAIRARSARRQAPAGSQVLRQLRQPHGGGRGRVCAKCQAPLAAGREVLRELRDGCGLGKQPAEVRPPGPREQRLQDPVRGDAGGGEDQVSPRTAQPRVGIRAVTATAVARPAPRRA